MPWLPSVITWRTADGWPRARPREDFTQAPPNQRLTVVVPEWSLSRSKTPHPDTAFGRAGSDVAAAEPQP